MKLKHKFKAQVTEADGIKFSSKKEAARYHQLKLLQKSGDIITFIMQPPFYLPGGVVYKADFLIWWSDGTCTVEDVKGYKTEMYIAKKKMVEALYAPIKIIEV